jgi:hypothetical protein
MSFENLNAENRGLILGAPPLIRRQPCCLFCRQMGHNIRRCNSDRLRDFELNCANMIANNSLNEFKNWLGTHNELLLRAFAIRKFRTVTNRTSISDCINLIYTYTHRNYVYRTRLEPEQDFENDLMGFIQELATPRQDIPNEIPEIEEVRAMESILMREMLFGMVTRMYRNYISGKLNILSSVVNDENEDIHKQCECSICYDEKQIKNFVKLGCNHEFCKDCFISTIKISQKNGNDLSCALCRAEVKSIKSRTNQIHSEMSYFIA